MDLQATLQALTWKQEAKNKAWDYYQGNHPLVYSHARLAQVFRGLDARFQMNWCAPIADAVMERIRLNGFSAPGSPLAQAALNRIWQACGLAAEAADAHCAAVVTGEAYLLAWRDAPDQPVECYYHDPRQMHVWYDADRPAVKRVAGKFWVDGDRTAITLFYPDRVEQYHGPKWTGEPVKAESFVLSSESVNPFGEVPVFHLRRDRSGEQGEFQNLYPLQDAVNKLLNDMMISSEFGVFAQRYVVSNAEIGTLKNSPNEIWHIPAGDREAEATQIGQFEATRLENFLEPLADLATAMAVISRTPRHYLLRQGGDPSGEAMGAMEAPLIHKVEALIARFGPVWADLARFLLKLDGFEEPVAVSPRFESPKSTFPKTQAEIRKLSVEAGVPLSTHLAMAEGWTSEMLAQLEDNGHERIQQPL